MTPAQIYHFIDELYTHNSFVTACGIKTRAISCGRACVGLRIDDSRHTNLTHNLAGGLIATLIDNATGIAGATIGKRVVTLSMTIDFLKAASAGALVEAEACITHTQGNVISMRTHIYDRTHKKVLGSGISTMFAVGDYPGIPPQWEGSYTLDENT